MTTHAAAAAAAVGAICHVRPYLQRLVDLVGAGQLAVALDPVPFTGLGAVADAVARLQSGASSGKVVVQLSRELPAVGARAKL